MSKFLKMNDTTKWLMMNDKTKCCCYNSNEYGSVCRALSVTECLGEQCFNYKTVEQNAIEQEACIKRLQSLPKEQINYIEDKYDINIWRDGKKGRDLRRREINKLIKEGRKEL